MAEETLRTFKAYELDIEKMTRMYGSPQWRAFRIALAKAGCEHPEGMRTYTSARIRPDGQPFTEDASDFLTISGFHCNACGNYVFPAPDHE